VTSSARRLLAPALAGALLLAGLAHMTMLTLSFTDYEQEALPSVTALLGGDVSGFLAHLPAYGGSLILRAPAALAAHALGGDETAVFHALAIPALVAALAFALVLWSHLEGRSRGAAWIALAVVAANPVIIPALDIGHPEELLGAFLCAGAVLAARGDRAVLAGVLLGLAGANKAWAVFAVIPVLMALRTRRVVALGIAGVVAGVVLAPMLAESHASGAVSATAHNTGSIFQPWQAWWFLGSHGAPVHGLTELKVGYRTAPGWISQVAHPLVVAVPVLFAAFAAARRGTRDPLLLLATCMLARCVLDPWNTAYYALPFVMALAAHEVFERDRAPIGALLASALTYGTITVLSTRTSAPADTQSFLYLAWSLPALGLMISSVLGKPVRTSWPSLVTTTRSSIRTPTAPGT
jgi:hypothetical protein